MPRREDETQEEYLSRVDAMTDEEATAELERLEDEKAELDAMLDEEKAKGERLDMEIEILSEELRRHGGDPGEVIAGSIWDDVLSGPPIP